MSADSDLSPDDLPTNDDGETLVATLSKWGVSFTDQLLLQQALTHRSALEADEIKNYERLEFLGDAVLDLAVADLLSSEHPQVREGELSKMRAALVNTESLAELTRTMGLQRYIRLGRSEQKAGGLERPGLLADVFEALLGALYRDQGFPAALSFISTLLKGRLALVSPRDPKTELQEVLHGVGRPAPTYQLERTEGPQHAPQFVSVVVIDGEILGRGAGASKKASEQLAAEQALTVLKERGTAHPSAKKMAKVEEEK
jgi:ribonuclease-3